MLHRLRAVPTLAALALAVSSVSASAGSQTYSLTGSVRLQTGLGLAHPITLLAPPAARVQAVSGATALQTTSSTPAKVVLPADALQASAVPLTLPIHLFNPLVFQHQTSLAANFPSAMASFQAGGRTGSPTHTICLPQGCGFGSVRYVKTLNQFGGPARATFNGSASVAVRVASPAPCSGPLCQAMFRSNRPDEAFGGPFGLQSSVTEPAPSPGRYSAVIGAAGTVSTLLAPLGPGLAQTRTAFAGPWTTGRVTVSVPAASPPLLYTLSGSDARTPGGLGTLSLVSGGLVNRSALGPTGTFGWLTLQFTPEPAALVQQAACVALLAGLAGVWRRRNRRTLDQGT